MWLVPGRLFHRCHSYEPFSYGGEFGEGDYQVDVMLLFNHTLAIDQTTVSLVYPLTNVGSKEMRGDPVIEDLDGVPTNQNSVLEGLDDMVFSTSFAAPDWLTDPYWPIASDWAQYEFWPNPNNASQFLDPFTWEVSVQVGGTYSIFESVTAFVWSDVNPDIVNGDFTGDGAVTWRDPAALFDFIQLRDGQVGYDADGEINGEVEIIGFGPGFNLYDMNYDGLVNLLDYPVLPTSTVQADFDEDGDVDNDDFGHFQGCSTGPALVPPADACYDADLDRDFDVDQEDFGIFQVCLTGPDGDIDPSCAD
jgi:hypothetical protein